MNFNADETLLRTRAVREPNCHVSRVLIYKAHYRRKTTGKHMQKLGDTPHPLIP